MLGENGSWVLEVVKGGFVPCVFLAEGNED